MGEGRGERGERRGDRRLNRHEAAPPTPISGGGRREGKIGRERGRLATPSNIYTNNIKELDGVACLNELRVGWSGALRMGL